MYLPLLRRNDAPFRCAIRRGHAASITQMTRQHARGLDQRIPCEPYTEVAEQNPRHTRGTAAARGELRNAQRSRSRFGTKGLVHSQAVADRVERLAVALRCQ